MDGGIAFFGIIMTVCMEHCLVRRGGFRLSVWTAFVFAYVVGLIGSTCMQGLGRICMPWHRSLFEEDYLPTGARWDHHIECSLTLNAGNLPSEQVGGLFCSLVGRTIAHSFDSLDFESSRFISCLFVP